jgi:hypothetical protein
MIIIIKRPECGLLLFRLFGPDSVVRVTIDCIGIPVIDCATYCSTESTKSNEL